MKPSFARRLIRLLSHDSSLARLMTSIGLVLLGLSMACGMGAGRPGYTLLEQAWPIEFWGVVYLTTGCWGVYGSVSRLPFWVRVLHTMFSMWLWAFLALAQFADHPLPTRLLLILPAMVDLWVLVKVWIAGPRKEKE